MVMNIDEMKAKMLAEDPRAQMTPEEERESENNTWVTSWSGARSGMDTYPIEEYVDDFHHITFIILDQNGAEHAVEAKVERGMLEIRALDGSLATMQTGATNTANIVVFGRSPQPQG